MKISLCLKRSNLDMRSVVESCVRPWERTHALPSNQSPITADKKYFFNYVNYMVFRKLYLGYQA